MRDFVGSCARGDNPLLVHAVQGKSNLGSYLPYARKFLDWVDEKGADFGKVDENDGAMGDYFAEMCYRKQKGPSIGKSTLSGYLHLYPKHRDHMQYARRALGTWKKLHPQKEKEPVPEELLMLMGYEALADGRFDVALQIMLHFDCLFRNQDMDQMHKRDVKLLKRLASFTLGDPERGESVKTGVDQGVLLYREWLYSMLKEYYEARPEGKFFMRGEDYDRMYAKYGQRVGAKPKRSYRLRHSGASHYIFYKILEEETTQRRGRWMHRKSMIPYTKLHLLVCALAEIPEDSLRRGAYLASNPEVFRDAWIREFRAAGSPANGIGGHISRTRLGTLEPPTEWELPDRYTEPQLNYDGGDDGVEEASEESDI